MTAFVLYLNVVSFYVKSNKRINKKMGLKEGKESNAKAICVESRGSYLFLFVLVQTLCNFSCLSKLYVTFFLFRVQNRTKPYKFDKSKEKEGNVSYNYQAYYKFPCRCSSVTAKPNPRTYKHMVPLSITDFVAFAVIARKMKKKPTKFQKCRNHTQSVERHFCSGTHLDSRRLNKLKNVQKLYKLTCTKICLFFKLLHK